MGKQRATCPYCGKFSREMYNPELTRKRDKVHCMHCGKTYSVVYGDGNIKTEKL